MILMVNPAVQRIVPGLVMVGECWVYPGEGRYANVAVQGRSVGVHRLMYETAKGPIPDGFQIDHLCRRKRCANPKHLEAVTGDENMRRTRKQWCVNGHDLDIHARKIGKTRRCWECHKANATASRRRAVSL